MCALNMMIFSVRLHSSMNCWARQTVHINVVFEFPPNAGCRICVEKR